MGSAHCISIMHNDGIIDADLKVIATYKIAYT